MEGNQLLESRQSTGIAGDPDRKSGRDVQPVTTAVFFDLIS